MYFFKGMEMWLSYSVNKFVFCTVIVFLGYLLIRIVV